MTAIGVGRWYKSAAPATGLATYENSDPLTIPPYGVVRIGNMEIFINGSTEVRAGRRASARCGPIVYVAIGDDAIAIGDEVGPKLGYAYDGGKFDGMAYKGFPGVRHGDGLGLHHAGRPAGGLLHLPVASDPGARVGPRRRRPS